MSEDEVTLTKCGAAFRTFLTKLHNNVAASFWLCAFEVHGDNLADLTKDELKELDGDIKELRQNLNQMTLQKRSGLGREEFNELLLECNLLQEQERGGEVKLVFAKDKWTGLLGLCIGESGHRLEIEKSKVKGYSGQRYFIRIGPKNEGFHTTPNKQVKAQSFVAPRTTTGDNINTLQRALKYETRQLINYNPYGYDDPEEDPPTEEPQSPGEEPPANSSSQGDDDNTTGNIPHVVRRLQRYGIDCDLSKDESYRKVKEIIGDLFALQKEYKEDEANNTIEYYKPSQNTTSYAVCLSTHISEDAFNRYHRRDPYIKEFIDVMSISQSDNNSEDGVGPRRLAEYVAWMHPKTYADVANEKGLAVLDC